MRITDENTEDDNDLEAAALVDSGYEYNSLGQYERAIKDYDEAIRLDLQDPMVEPRILGGIMLQSSL
jgi:tetratricopeptide (TPR) repeat protein